ncbi:trans-sulfuration enzyme family protein [Priestia koreensis]|uniref:trans-sulfuration enzyme family protein n=1 Tax=Priestia koreensis TaxID=284581 RepID=UPI00203D36A9|nr:PLP-dependent aspartate aminotransferase family protein [Priestia koreensis]MCM3003240.1 PLP-dependent aspartate aminotransferase family protein [Priestia koreensis]
MHIRTKLVQAGIRKDPSTGSLTTPIYQASTFQHPRLGESTGYDYSRTANPTRTALEEAIAVLEEGEVGLAFSSGMAAITSLLYLFKNGDHLVVSEDLYGGTYRVLSDIVSEHGITVTYVNTAHAEEIEEAVQPNTKALFIETPTNPLTHVTDLEKAIEIAKKYDLWTIVDNTFMSPYFQRPLALGADLVVHSASKYIGGHNDVIGGLVVARSREIGEKVRFYQNAVGAILGPQDCWLLIRGLKTLGLRMERHQENALKIAQWLTECEQVEIVYYPGLVDHPGHEIMKRQATGFGGMISFTVKEEELVPFLLEHLKVITFAESLGGVESLITFPARQTHADIPEEIRNSIGVTNSLLRLSVGIEHVDDLIQDLKEVFHEFAKTAVNY